MHIAANYQSNIDFCILPALCMVWERNTQRYLKAHLNSHINIVWNMKSVCSIAAQLVLWSRKPSAPTSPFTPNAYHKVVLTENYVALFFHCRRSSIYLVHSAVRGHRSRHVLLWWKYNDRQLFRQIQFDCGPFIKTVDVHQLHIKMLFTSIY